MSKSNYAGLDYSGPGATCNRDPSLGIRYGVISQHSVQQDAMSGIWDNSQDLSWEHAKDDMLDRIMASLASETQDERLANVAHDIKYLYRDPVCRSVAMEIEELGGDSAPSRQEVWDVISDRFGDTYECDDRDWCWEEDGYVLENCLQSDMFVSKSPYFTYAQFCSPCIPGGCNLDSPYEPEGVAKEQIETVARIAPNAVGEAFISYAEMAGFAKCYCLGHTFFDDDKAPYEVFSVATGRRVVMVEKSIPCPSCNGTGVWQPTGITCGYCRGTLSVIAKVEEEQ